MMRKINKGIRYKQILVISSMILGICLGCFRAPVSEAIIVVNNNNTIAVKNDSSSGNTIREDAITNEENKKKVDAFFVDEEETYSIVPFHAAGSALTLYSANEVVLSTRYRKDYQLWKFHREGDFFYIQNEESGKVLTAKDGAATNGEKVVGTNYSKKNSQLWRIEFQREGGVKIQSKINTNYIIDITGRKKDNGTPAQLYKYSNAANARYYLIKEKSIKPVDSWGSSLSGEVTNNVDEWSGAVDTSWYTDNQYNRSYVIENAEQLAGLAKIVNDGIFDFFERNISLETDIDMNFKNWKSIGNSDHPFKGFFNGNGHTVTNLKCNHPEESQIGLFGFTVTSSIANLSIKGSVTGFDNVGSVVGEMKSTIIDNVYSEVKVKVLGDTGGGIIGKSDIYCSILNCTANGKVVSLSGGQNRGGVAGYSGGSIRYCVNKGFVNGSNICIGGIAGYKLAGLIEYSANYHPILGGVNTSYIGGICGKIYQNAVVFGCCNYANVYGGGVEAVGGVIGCSEYNSSIYCSMNTGDIQGKTNVGGIVGEGNCNNSFNYGYVNGNSNVGSITGKYNGSIYSNDMNGCYGIKYSAPALNGSGKDRGAVFLDAQSFSSGYLCYNLNNSGFSYMNYGYNIEEVFYQTIQVDIVPTLSGRSVFKEGDNYYNDKYEIIVDYNDKFGTVNGGGITDNRKVVLEAKAKKGYIFDHYEIVEIKTGTKTMYKGYQDYNYEEVTEVKDAKYTLTEDLDRCYRVRAVFLPNNSRDSLSNNKQLVVVKLRNLSPGFDWYTKSIPFCLTDSLGEEHFWEVPVNNISAFGDEISHSFYIGNAVPTQFEAFTGFESGKFSIKAEIKVVNADSYPEETRLKTLTKYADLNSLLAITPDYNDYRSYISTTDETDANENYLDFDLEGYGSATVIYKDNAGAVQEEKIYNSYERAINAALGKSNYTVKLNGAWYVCRTIDVKQTLNVDLNGYPIIYTVANGAVDNGLFNVGSGGDLTITDSKPYRRSTKGFNGGNIQFTFNNKGNSNGTNGIIQVNNYGKFSMTGGALCDGFTTSKGGGAIKCEKGTVNLTGVTITNCSAPSNQGGALYLTNVSSNIQGCTFVNCNSGNNGGAIYVGDGCINTNIFNSTFDTCKSYKGEGGAISLEYTLGKVNVDNCTFDKCSALNGGAISHKSGLFVIDYSVYEDNRSTGKGGAINSDSSQFIIVKHSNFQHNKAGSSGGCISINNWGARLIANEMAYNNAESNGGAIYVAQQNVFLSSCDIHNNGCGSYGGGIYVESNHNLDIEGKCIVKNNYQKDGKGDITLSNAGTKIYVGYLEDDSEIGLNVAGTINKNNILVEGVRGTRVHCFKPNRGSMYTKNEHEGKQIYMATVVKDDNSNFRKAIYVVIILEVVGFILVMANIIRKRKKEQKDNVNN